MGQDIVIKALKHAISKESFHHAYLFTGGRGVGKTTIARLIAKAINCTNCLEGEPCNECKNCEEIDDGRFVDVLEVDAASNRGVDEIQSILDQIHFFPALGKRKVLIIDEVHMLSNHAFNVMLKTLEEPPEHIVFILATTDPKKIPATVISRCLRFSLNNIPEDKICEHVMDILKRKNVPFERGAISQISAAAEGSLRDALSISDQAIACGEGKITLDNVNSMLGYASTLSIDGLIDAIQQDNVDAALSISREMLNSGADAGSILEELAVRFHSLSLKQLSNISFDDSEMKYTSKNLATLSLTQCNFYYQIVTLGRRDMPLAPNPLVGLEMVLIRLFAFQLSEKTNDVLIKEGKKKSSKKHDKLITQINADQPVANKLPKKIDQLDQMTLLTWPTFVSNLGCEGLLRQFLYKTEYDSFSEDKNIIEIKLKVSLEILMDSALIKKAEVFLTDFLKKEISITVEKVESVSNSFEMIEKANSLRDKRVAKEAFKKNAGIMQLLAEFEAEIINESLIIKK